MSGMMWTEVELHGARADMLGDGVSVLLHCCWLTTGRVPGICLRVKVEYK